MGASNTEPDASTWRSAAAYALGARVVVHALVGQGGYYLAAAPAIGLSLSAGDDELGASVREALAAHRSVIPEGPASAAMKPVLRAVGARSQRQLQEEGRHCWIEDTADGFVLTPTHNGGNRGEQRGFAPLADAALRLPANASTSALGRGLRTALERCT